MRKHSIRSIGFGTLRTGAYRTNTRALALGALIGVSALTLAIAFVAGGCDKPTPSDPSPKTTDARVLPASAKKPNIVFILVDTLRADRLGVYGHPGKLTPAMDALAAEGTRFERCQSAASWTLPSIASIFSSYYPSVHKATDYKKVEALRKGGEGGADETQISIFSDEFDTLAEILAANGYDTAGFSLNPFIQAKYGFSQGFSFFADGVKENGAIGSAANHDAIAWLDEKRNKGKPFFLYMHYMDCHGPYDAPAKYVDPLMQAMEANSKKTKLTPIQIQMLRDHPTIPELRNYLRRKPPIGSDPTRYERLKDYQEYWIAGYEAGVREQDDYIAELFDGLRKRGLWDETFVILTADHGEAFAEHNYWEHGPGLHQHQVSVPLILRWPGMLPKSRTIAGTVRTIDIMPTILAQVGIEWKSGQGTSLLPAIGMGKTNVTEVIYSESAKTPDWDQDAILTGNWKLIRYQPTEKNPNSGGEQLFDLSSDPGETKDIIREKLNVARDLVARMEEQVRINAGAKPGHEAKYQMVTPQERQKISGVGYTGDDVKEPDSQPSSKPMERP